MPKKWVALNKDQEELVRQHVELARKDERERHEGWLKESMERCAKSDFQFVYKEGWAGAVYDIMARSDAWKKQQKQLEV